MFKWFGKEVKPLPKESETEVLFDCAEVSGFQVRPWNLEKCEKVAPIIAEITQNLKTKRLKLQDFFVREGEDIKVINIEHIVFACLPFLSSVFAITLEKEAKDFAKLDQDTIMRLATTILYQNMSFLKNSFALSATIAMMIEQGKL